LVDPEGYPRSDIDVWAIRQARASLARLRNDHRAVVDRLGRILELVYARDPDAPAVSVEETRKDEGAGEEGMMNGHAEVVVEERRPIARVNTVASGSPASSAVSPSVWKVLGLDR
jgi:26S proteasome non-ATPase regulatory subunit 9